MAPVYSTPEFQTSRRTWSPLAYTLSATAPILSPRTSSPFTSRTQSPTTSPALSAGEPSSTSLTQGYGSHWVRLRWNPQDPWEGRSTRHCRSDGEGSCSSELTVLITTLHGQKRYLSANLVVTDYSYLRITIIGSPQYWSIRSNKKYKKGWIKSLI